jgi:hypothetical protein
MNGYAAASTRIVYPMGARRAADVRPGDRGRIPTRTQGARAREAAGLTRQAAAEVVYATVRA